MKRILGILLILNILPVWGQLVFGAPVFDEACVTVNGIVLDDAGYIIDGRTLVPMRAVLEAVGAEVNWSSEERTVYAKKDNVLITLAIGSNEMSVLTKKGTRLVELDVPARTIVSSTYIPLRAVAEALGCSVYWNGSLKRAEIEFEEKASVIEESVETTTYQAFDDDFKVIYDKEDEDSENRIDGIVVFQNGSIVTILTNDGKKLTFDKKPYVYKDRANSAVGMAVTVFYEGDIKGEKAVATKLYRTKDMKSIDGGSIEFYNKIAEICENGDLSALGDICEYPVNIITVDGLEACESKEYLMDYVAKYVITEQLKEEVKNFNLIKLVPNAQGEYKIGGNINITFKKTEGGFGVTSVTAAERAE